MRYTDIREGRFLDRPNRFIAHVSVDGVTETVHVKNTGRCKELLREGVTVYLEKSGNPNRSTAYDLVAVRKGERIINMDSAAPNRAAGEWLEKGGLYPEVESVTPECTYGSSRFDFRIQTRDRQIWVEVKGVTLEDKDTALFPDAPSLRALKHVEELARARREGFGAVLLFVVQMEGIRCFRPNRATQPEFADALLRARRAGVEILARGCRVTEEGMEIAYEIPVELELEAEDMAEAEQESPEKPDCARAEQNEAGQIAQGQIALGQIALEQIALEHIAPRLLPWYDENRRLLPWREDASPYRVWVSEIMLQQTRVEAVKPYFERFMVELPDIEALASVEEERLLKLWEGLGYYNRARNLQKAARKIMEEYEGHMPSRMEELLSLPGIGSYTAGAVASIAYGRPVPAVDGNVLRVLARFRMDGEDMTKPGVRKRIEQELAEAVPKDRPGDFNQAMMELGATVCLPNGAPRCHSCPLSTLCQAHTAGRELDFPGKKKKKERLVEEKTILVIQDGRKAAIRRRPPKGLLAGMYELPSMEGRRSREEVLLFLKEKGLRPIRIREMPEAKHIFTHREWRMTGFAVRVDELEPYCGDWEGLLFVDPADTRGRFPIPSAFAAYTGCLNIRPGNSRYETAAADEGRRSGRMEQR